MEKTLVSNLNKYLANISVLFVKTHNLHWNVLGPDFKPVHEYLETIYDGYADVLDAVAEILKMHDEFPLASMKDYLAVTTIKELPSKSISTSEAVKIVLEDLNTLKKDAEAIRKEADKADLYDVVSLMEGDLGNYNKTIWFIKSMTTK